jgi:hypothetical protein
MTTLTEELDKIIDKFDPFANSHNDFVRHKPIAVQDIKQALATVLCGLELPEKVTGEEFNKLPLQLQLRGYHNGRNAAIDEMQAAKDALIADLEGRYA